MTLRDIEKLVEASPYDLVAFPISTFPSELINSIDSIQAEDRYVRYCKKPRISANPGNFIGGWKITPYGYGDESHMPNITIIDFHKFFIPKSKKLKLIEALKDYK